MAWLVQSKNFLPNPRKSIPQLPRLPSFFPEMPSIQMPKNWLFKRKIGTSAASILIKACVKALILKFSILLMKCEEDHVPRLLSQAQTSSSCCSCLVTEGLIIHTDLKRTLVRGIDLQEIRSMELWQFFNNGLLIPYRIYFL